MKGVIIKTTHKARAFSQGALRVWPTRQRLFPRPIKKKKGN